MVISIPRYDLHMHLGGSYPLEYIKKISKSSEYSCLLSHIKELRNKNLNYSSVFNIFGIIERIVDNDKKVYKGVIALCKKLKKQGIEYVELRTTLKNFGIGFENNLKTILKAIQKGTRDKRLKVNLLLGLKRDFTRELAKKIVNLSIKYQGKGVVGLDILGNEELGDIGNILEEILIAKKHGLKITMHIGESEIDENLHKVLEIIKPDRVSHAVNLSLKSKKWLYKNKTPIEICLTSNALTGAVESIEKHPVVEYYNKGHPFVLCTDDPLIFENRLETEFRLFFSIINKNSGFNEIYFPMKHAFKQDSWNLKIVNQKIKDFCDKRDWDKFHGAKELAIALSIEASELLEIFRWKNSKEVESLFKDNKKREDIEDEIADVFYFLLRITQRYNIDLIKTLDKKMEKNKIKYPVEKARGSNKKYNEL